MPSRPFREEVLVIASHNDGKIAEIADLLADFPVTVKSASQVGATSPAETGTTFADNALIKSRYTAHLGQLPALSDDSGLCVAALNDAPGIHSARWSKNGDFSSAMQRIHDALPAHTDKDNVRARFVCALALSWPDGHDEVYEGCVHGRLVWPARGDKGFGYDPIFIPDGDTRTFAEMPPAQKHALSHRARAFSALVAACFASAVPAR